MTHVSEPIHEFPELNPLHTIDQFDKIGADIIQWVDRDSPEFVAYKKRWQKFHTPDINPLRGSQFISLRDWIIKHDIHVTDYGLQVMATLTQLDYTIEAMYLSEAQLNLIGYSGIYIMDINRPKAVEAHVGDVGVLRALLTLEAPITDVVHDILHDEQTSRQTHEHTEPLARYVTNNALPYYLVQHYMVSQSAKKRYESLHDIKQEIQDALYRLYLATNEPKSHIQRLMTEVRDYTEKYTMELGMYIYCAPTPLQLNAVQVLAMRDMFILDASDVPEPETPNTKEPRARRYHDQMYEACYHRVTYALHQAYLENLIHTYTHTEYGFTAGTESGEESGKDDQHENIFLTMLERACHNVRQTLYPAFKPQTTRQVYAIRLIQNQEIREANQLDTDALCEMNTYSPLRVLPFVLDVWHQELMYYVSYREKTPEEQEQELWFRLKQANANDTNDIYDTLIPIYRGVGSRSTPLENQPLSWTIDPDVAEFFATRFDDEGVVLKGYVPLRHILLFIGHESEEQNHTSEREVIVEPKFIQNIHARKHTK